MSTNKKYNRNQKKSPTPGKLNTLNNLEQLATEMDLICRRRLPDGRIPNGSLAGKEPEIRQQALIQTLGGFIQQNKGYIDAVNANDVAAIKGAMEKCVAIKMHHVKMQIASETTRAASRFVQLDDRNGGVCQHPTNLESSDWPPDVKAGVVSDSVQRAVRKGQLSVGNATIVDLLCTEDLSVAQAAQRLGISPEAIYQQLRRVTGVLPGMFEYAEVKWGLFL